MIDHLAKEVCIAVKLKSPQSKFDVSDEVTKTCLATALVEFIEKVKANGNKDVTLYMYPGEGHGFQVIGNPPTFVSIQWKYTKRASTPAVSNASNLSTGLPNGAGGSFASPEVSSGNLSVASSTLSHSRLAIADFMDLGVLRRAKKRRFNKLSKAELAGLINHHMKRDAPQSATKGFLVKTLMGLLPVTPSTKVCSHSNNC